jgi:hypothetical protein
MFGWFSKTPPMRLTFDTNEEAFAHACRLQGPEILLEAVIPALVLERGEADSDGTRHFLLRLADRTGGRELWGVTLKEATSYPEAGDLVGFRIVKIASDLPVDMSIIGFIAVKLSPEYLEKKGWRIEASYTPENIRQTVRW